MITPTMPLGWRKQAAAERQERLGLRRCWVFIALAVLYFGAQWVRGCLQ